MSNAQKNIKEFNKKIPQLKEKLIATALIFAMSAGMLATSSFAWITLSKNPQVSEINTSIASNGNLEIALVQGTASTVTSPESSKVGDSTKDTLLRNVTWGNLINLNDSRYGLKNLVLRPSLLNDTNLIERPLYGPVYDRTGRVVDMNTNFGYSLWDNTMKRFTASDALGVRAITSMTYGESGSQNIYNAQLNLAESANARFKTRYESLAYNQDYMDALASMMTGYMVQNILKVNSSVGGMISDATLSASDLKEFANMYEDVILCFEEQADVYANLLNLQATINKKDIKITAAEILHLSYDVSAKTAYKALIEKGYTTYADSNKTVGIIKDMDNFLYDYALLKADLQRINDLIAYITKQNKTSISWPSCPTVEGTTTRIIDDIINNLTNVGECTITGGEYTNLKIKNVGATAALALKEVKCCETKITNGILYNMDSRSGARIRNDEEKPLKLSVQVMGTQTITSNVSTSATDNYFENERALIAETIKKDYGAPELIANDSYGFAVDFWVRTNAANSYLTLQGNVLTRTDTIDVMGKDLNGEDVNIYTITVKMNTEDDGESSGSSLEDMMVISYDVYHSTYVPEGQNEEQECLRFADSHQVVTEEALDGQEIPAPIKKVEQIETVIGYEGDNRIWEGENHSLLTVSSTTQGSGSCYVFYADTPVDQQRSLELLKSLKVAFVDETGKLLTTAYLDTERNYSSTGKVIVPLVLDSSSISIGEDVNGVKRNAITALEQNVATRITAIVYLDGTNLTNDKVLASSDIQGQMNIQFGSSVALVPLSNQKLYNAELYADVDSIEPNEFDYDTLADGQQMISKVKIKVTGDQPKTMTANFIRRINESQGSPEEVFTLNDTDGDGIWEGEYTFLYPGEYILRSVEIDGAERNIRIAEGEDYPTVKVNGFSIKSVSYSMNDFVMSDANLYTGKVSLEFGIDNPEKMPKTVIGKFMRDDGAAVNVNFVYNPTLASWQGNANFVSSGVYTMQYVILDGQYVELAPLMQKTVDLTLGMKVDVQTTSPTTIFYGEDSAPDSLKIEVKILDNNNEIIPNLAGAEIRYTMTGSEELYAGLIYNSGAQCYEGEFPVESGTWKFDHVTIRIGETQTNNLFKANSDAPVFTVVPPTPPSYVTNAAQAAQFVSANSSDNATFTVSLKESGSATVYAKLVNKDGSSDVKYILGTLTSSANDIYNYIFNIEESGLWELESVSAFGVFDENQNYHPIPDSIDDATYQTGIVFDNTNSSFVNTTFAVLYERDITVSFGYDDDKLKNQNGYLDNTANKNAFVFGKTGGSVTGTFMQSHTLATGTVKVNISDEHKLIENGYFDISGVALSYKYGSLTDASGQSYGGYTGGEYVAGYVAKTIKFDGEKTSFAQSDDVAFTYAAQYVPDALSYNLSYTNNEGKKQETTITLNNSGAYKIEVYSTIPTLTLSVSPSSVSYDGASGHTSGTNTVSVNNQNKETTVTAYIGCTKESGKIMWVIPYEYHKYTASKVDITLGNSGYAKSIRLLFKDSSGNETTHLYTSISNPTGQENTTVTPAGYSWGGSNTVLNGCNATVARYVGYSKYSDFLGTSSGSKTAAGVITANELIATYGNYTYTFAIPKITINNPY